jgi:protein subunit release factor A
MEQVITKQTNTEQVNTEQINKEQKEMPKEEINDKSKKRKKTYNEIMQELLKPPPKEDKPNIHLSGGGQFSKLEKI